MTVRDGTSQDSGSARFGLWLLAPLAVVLAVLAVGAIVVTSLSGVAAPPRQADAADDPPRDLPVYWTVKRGDTFSQIAERTGLSIETLQSFNPRVDATTIAPGQRIKLRRNVPKPKAKPLGPEFRTVRSGESFGSIAADTGIAIDTLRRLNTRLKPTQLRPGDRMRLRRK